MNSLPTSSAATCFKRALPKRLPNMPTSTDIQAMVDYFAVSRDARVRADIVIYYQKYVRYLATRVSRGSEPLEDLIQIGTLGLIRALDGYDPQRRIKFAAYATPSIVGEIKHYLRDKSWHIKVPRALQERLLAVQQVEKELSLHYNRRPTVPEISARLGLSEEATLEAMEMGRNSRAMSLNTVFEGPSEEGCALEDRVGAPDAALHDLVVYEALWQALGCLPTREQEIIRLRFFEELPQDEIAEKVSLSQMHVSRLLRRALDRLQGMLAE